MLWVRVSNGPGAGLPVGQYLMMALVSGKVIDLDDLNQKNLSDTGVQVLLSAVAVKPVYSCAHRLELVLVQYIYM